VSEYFDDRRPDVRAVSAAHDVTGWYWTRDELVQIARNYGVRTGGSKTELEEHITAKLSGGAPESGEPRPRVAVRLVAPFALRMPVPAGQPFSRELRQWMTQRLGREFRVTQAMRDFMKNPQGGTLRDLLVLAEQSTERSVIPKQFELNRFMRILALQQPNLTHPERIAAWRQFRQRPSPDRERILSGDEPWHPSSRPDMR
jgi:hypothetical protein